MFYFQFDYGDFQKDRVFTLTNKTIWVSYKIVVFLKMMRNLRTQRSLHGICSRKWQALHAGASYVNGRTMVRLLEATLRKEGESRGTFKELWVSAPGVAYRFRSQIISDTKWIQTHLLALFHRCLQNVQWKQSKSWSREGELWVVLWVRGSIHQMQGSQADTSGQNSRAEKNLSEKLQAFRKSKAKTESEVGALREGVLGIHPLLTPAL